MLAGTPHQLVATGAVDALRWLFKEEAFQAVVAESKPLFAKGATVAEARLSRFVYGAPIAALVLAWSFRSASSRQAIARVAGYSARWRRLGA